MADRLKLRPLAAARRINRTGRRAFDRVARDPRVVDVWDEDRDGVWAELAPGFNWDGCGTVHGIAEDEEDPARVRRRPAREIAADMLADLDRVTRGPTY